WTSSPPIAPASANMSACRRQAVSQVGCRLMVASSAKTSRPRWPAAVAGSRLLTWARKASMSEGDDTGAGRWSAGFAGAGVLTGRSFGIGTLPSPSIGRGTIRWRCQRRRAMCPNVREPAGSVAENVVQLKRTRRRRRPFGSCCSAATAAFVDRQLERGEQRLDLLLRGDVRHAGPGTEGRLVEAVEGGQAAREDLAIDHAFGEAVDESEAEPAGEFVEALADQPLVARPQHGEAVAHHDPISHPAVDQPALAARLAHHLRVVAGAGQGKGFR